MRRTWTTKILGAVAARLLLTTVDQVHHYDLQETNKTGEGADREPEGGPPGRAEERDLPGSRQRTLKQLVRRAREGLGHPNVDRFVRILKSAKATDWERNLRAIPFLAVTDSKSLYDTLSKKTCPFSRIDDKRTAIDVSILKRDLEGAGTVRWVDGRNMISDNLTKNTGGNYLRFVMSRGQWTLNEQGFTELEAHRTTEPTECLFMCPDLWHPVLLKRS